MDVPSVHMLHSPLSRSLLFQQIFQQLLSIIVLRTVNITMTSSPDIDSPYKHNPVAPTTLLRDTSLPEPLRRLEKDPSEPDEISQMLTMFKQFLRFTKAEAAKTQELEDYGDPRELEPRDRKVTIPLPQGELTEEQLQKFLTKVCKIVWSRAFQFYSTEQLSYESTKIYSSEEILRNICRLSEKFQLKPRHFQIINVHLQERLLEYKMAKYPITQSQEVNRNVHNAVREIDNTDQPFNDYLFNSSVCFKFRESGEYNDLIMRLLNEIIKKIENKIGNKTVYQKFEEKMERLFDSVFDEDWMKETEQEKPIIDEFESKENLQLIHHRHSLSEEQFKKELIKIKQKQKEKYRAKVEEYTSYKIGKKLPDSTRLFTEEEIASHNLKIQSPQILRLLTKWCDQLETKFTTANYFEHYIETLKLQNGKFLVLVLNEVKENLDQLMAEEHRSIKAELAELAKNNYYMQSQLLLHQLKHGKLTQIQKYQSIAAKYSIDIVNNLHSYTLAYLNRLIHGLLKVAVRFTKLPIVSQFEWPSNISLITCQINDLVRCRCASGQREIIRIYNQILRFCDAEKMRMIKVSNRLKRGTHDVVLTVKYREVLCEIQLSVTNKIHKFAEYSNAFNHYLYELKRSVFGPLTELCNTWKSTDGRFSVYKTLANKKGGQNCPKLQHDCQNRNEYQAYYKPFICSSCGHHYYHNNYIKHHFKCKCCDFWVCARCQLDISDCKAMIAAAYKEDEIIARSNRIKRKNNSPIPDYGICIFIQSQSIKVEPFRKYHDKGRTFIIGVKKKQLYQIYDVSSEQDKNKFKEDFLVFQVGEAYGKRHIKIDDEKISQFFVIQQLNTIYEKNKEKICLNYNGISNDQFVSLCRMGSAAQRENIKRLQAIGNKLESVSALATTYRNLKQLELGKNTISNFEQIDKLQKLEILSVNDNKVKQFPIQVCRLWNLKELVFCDNQIRNLPDDLNNLHRLRVLKLSSNQIEEFPRCISQLCYLNELHLKNNKMKEIPEMIGSLNELQILELENNTITLVHSNISKLISLQNLNLSSNDLHDFPQSITQIKTLQSCNLKNNKITSVPFEINQLQNLSYLNLSNNQIIDFPAINFLTKLLDLDLSHNCIEVLKDFQSTRMSLMTLSIAYNNLRRIPSLVNLGSLEQLYANNNHIEVLPDSMGRLEKLEILHLEANQITRINQLRLESLKYLNLSQNKISVFNGMDFICAEEVDLSANCITAFNGNLMPCLKRLNIRSNSLQALDTTNYPKLKYIQAGMNKLQQFPKAEEKNHIKVLGLEHNFIKNIPSGATNFHNVAQLNVSFNQITAVPKEIQFFHSLKEHSLDLSHNPIDKVEAIEFLLKKCTQSTLQELEPLLKVGSQTKISKDEPPPSPSILQLSDFKATHTESNKTIQKI